MKKLIQRARDKALSAAYSAQSKALNTCGRAKAAVSNRKGQGALDTAVTVLISIVLGALILAGLYLILNGTVLPSVTKRIEDMFNYQG